MARKKPFLPQIRAAATKCVCRVNTSANSTLDIASSNPNTVASQKVGVGMCSADASLR